MGPTTIISTNVIFADELAALKSELRRVVRDERRPSVDWPAVQARCLEISLRLEPELQRAVPSVVLHFLDDADVRMKDRQYSASQHAKIREWLEM